MFLLFFGACTDSSNEDEVGKTVAIIVGVLAGIAVLIVLLSICRKAMSNNYFFLINYKCLALLSF